MLAKGFECPIQQHNKTTRMLSINYAGGLMMGSLFYDL